MVIEPIGEDEFVDDVENYIRDVPKGDVAVVQCHSDILYELPYLLNEKGYKLLIVPSETPSDLSINMRKKLSEICSDLGMEFENPKPFCGLKKRHNKPVLNEFIDYFRIGHPVMDIEVDNHKIKDVKVIVSAPCGETYYIGKRIKGKLLSEIKEEVANAHHNYPCLGSMEYDKELEDTILHEGGHIAIDGIKKALSKYKCGNKFCGKCGMI